MDPHVETEAEPGSSTNYNNIHINTAWLFHLYHSENQFLLLRIQILTEGK